MIINAIDSAISEKVRSFFTSHWGAPIMVSKGIVHHVDELSGYTAMDDNGQILGLITYSVVDDECEIISLDSIIENRGIGTALLKAVLDRARKRGYQRVWLVTTNDNARAMRFYQKNGFNMIALHVNAVNDARKLKPQIPIYGYDNIPIQHEIEFEIILSE